MNLPKVRDSEAQVIGAMIANPPVIAAVADLLVAEDFSSQTHGEFYGVIVEMFARGQGIDAVSVQHALRGRSDIDLSQLPEIVTGLLTAASAMHHAGAVKDASRLRRLALMGTSLTEEAMTEGTDARDLLERTEGQLYALSTDRTEDRVSWSVGLNSALNRIEYQHETGNVITGIPTGLRAIDHDLGGLQPGWLTLLGARTGGGKTALATQIGIFGARNGFKVMIASLEMSTEQLATRSLCSIAGVSYQRVRHNALKEQDWVKFVNAHASLADLPIEPFDTNVETIAKIRSKVRRTKPDLLIVDYVQMVQPATKRKDATRQEEVAGVSWGLKQIAREHDIAVLAPVQLNRSPSREERRPTLTDLRESGRLEQDADVVLFLHRKDSNATRIELIRDKFRFGPIGTDVLGWDAETTKFYDV